MLVRAHDPFRTDRLEHSHHRRDLEPDHVGGAGDGCDGPHELLTVGIRPAEFEERHLHERREEKANVELRETRTLVFGTQRQRS